MIWERAREGGGKGDRVEEDKLAKVRRLQMDGSVFNLIQHRGTS